MCGNEIILTAERKVVLTYKTTFIDAIINNDVSLVYLSVSAFCVCSRLGRVELVERIADKAAEK